MRQGILDHLAGRAFNLASMDVTVTSVEFHGNQADATVSFTPKGGSAAQGMSLQYRLEQKGNKWAVVGRKDAGGNPHGATVMPGTPNPHGGGMGAAGGMGAPAGHMPSIEDLPPANGQKK